MIRPPSWEREGRDWPNRKASRFVRAGGLRWHVQVAGQGPVVLLIHGTGAATHSWRDIIPRLAETCTVVAPDLPGHGFTGTPSDASGFTLPGVARGVAALLGELGLSPVLSVGHSAGAAIAIRMCLDGAASPDAVVSLNGALLPFPAISPDFLGSAARRLASSQLAAQAASLFTGSRQAVEGLLRRTGSRIDADGTRFYARLVGNAAQVHGALALMANWDLRPLIRDLPNLRARLVLVTGSNDAMVPSHEVYRVRALLPSAEVVTFKGLGHLAHEERPDEIAAMLERILAHEAAG
jgi:magnesium chelatase accessory protein